jgi:retinol dehydrogenase-12
MIFTLVLGLLIITIAFTVAMTEIREMARVTLFGSRNTSKGAAFESARDIPSLAGKVVLITGAAGDLGRNTAIQLARYGRPARIYVADLPRNDDAKTAVALRITHEAYGEVPADTKAAGPLTEIRYLDLDLSSLESVRKCAADFVAQEQRLDILYLNAGIIRVAPGVTAEDYEIHFGINYLGHALLSRLLVPTMLRTIQQQPDVRIVIVSSEGHVIAPKGGIDFNKLKTNGADIVSSSPLVFWPIRNYLIS